MVERRSSRARTAPDGPVRVESLRVENYRALRRIELADLTPLTVLLGPNGSGKSTVFDVFGFLSECFTQGLRKAWDKRGRFRELRTRGSDGPIVIELRYRERPDQPAATYRLEIDEVGGNPRVARETLSWRRVARSRPGAPYRILSFANGGGWVIAGPNPRKDEPKVKERLDEPDMLAVSTLGQLAKHPRVAALRRFVADWHVSRPSGEGQGPPGVPGSARVTAALAPDAAPPPSLIGIGEPEVAVYPQRLRGLAEACRRAAETSQVFVTTHSPYFVDGLRPAEVRVLDRDERGYSGAVRAADVRGVPERLAAGASLGQLWLEDSLRVDGRVGVARTPPHRPGDR